jgi:hypothetical protein
VATKCESLLNYAGNRNFGIGAGDSVMFAENPHFAGTVIDLEDTGADSTKGIHYTARNRDFFAGIAAGITVDLGDAFARGTAREKESCDYKR